MFEFTLTDRNSCACGALLVTKQDRKNGICPSCADAPAPLEISGNVLAAYALSVGHGTRLVKELDALTATIEAHAADPSVEAGIRKALSLLGISDDEDPFGEDTPRASALPTVAPKAPEDLPTPTEAEINAQWLALEEQGNFFGGRFDN